MMGTRGIRSTALFAASLALLAACSGEGSAAGGSGRDGSGPLIREYEPGTGGTLAQAHMKANMPYAFDDATLCLTSPGSVTVENVEIVRPTGGMRLGMFALRPGRTGDLMNYIADPRQRLTAVGYRTQGPRVVDRVGPELSQTKPPGPGYGVTLLGVELVKAADTTATASGFVVTYRSGKKRRTVYVPLGILLCKGDNTLPDCDRPLDLRPPVKR
jgi:hypothetical protein